MSVFVLRVIQLIPRWETCRPVISLKSNPEFSHCRRRGGPCKKASAEEEVKIFNRASSLPSVGEEVSSVAAYYLYHECFVASGSGGSFLIVTRSPQVTEATKDVLEREQGREAVHPGPGGT